MASDTREVPGKLEELSPPGWGTTEHSNPAFIGLLSKTISVSAICSPGQNWEVREVVYIFKILSPSFFHCPQIAASLFFLSTSL